MKNIRIIFFGNPQCVTPVLDLLRKHHTLCAIIASPDKPAGRHHALLSPATKIYGQENAVPVFQPEQISIETWKNLGIPDADLFVVAAYGKLLPQSIIDIPQYKTLNIHPSLLPLYRGPSPVQSSLLNGDSVTGVSIMRIDEKMDHGPILAQKELPISPDDTAETLRERLFIEGGHLLIDILPAWINKTLPGEPQDDTRATYTRMIRKELGRIEWNNSTQTIINQIRALTPWPGTFTFLQRDSELLRVKIVHAHRAQVPPDQIAPGYITNVNGTLVVGTGDGALIIDQLQPEGKTVLSGKNFLSGYMKGTPLFV